MQEHKSGIKIWPYKYRITMRENRMEISNSNDYSEILSDWEYLEKNVTPQIHEKIDVYKLASENIEFGKEAVSIILKLLKKFS